jgi:uncharacterized protein (TIGR00255 family)
MALQSMTGFARREGTTDRWRWAWELRSVNGKGLDVRLRLPPGLERLENDVKRLAGEQFSRGNMQVSLSVSSGENRFESVLNQEALATVLALRDQLAGIIDPEPLKLDTLLAIRGIIDFRETEDSPEAVAARDAEIMDGLALALSDLRQMRESEGAALSRVLLDQVAIVERLALVVENDPSRSPARDRRKACSAGCASDGRIGEVRPGPAARRSGAACHQGRSARRDRSPEGACRCHPRIVGQGRPDRAKARFPCTGI